MISASIGWETRARIANQNVAELRAQVQALKQAVADLVASECNTTELLRTMPPADVVALVEQAERAGCLSDEGRQWLDAVRG